MLRRTFLDGDVLVSLTQNSHVFSRQDSEQSRVSESFRIRAASHGQESPVTSSSSIWKKRQKGTKHHKAAINIIAQVESLQK